MTKNISTVDMSHDEWLAKHRDTIGSSDVGNILGLSDYVTPFQVYQEKKGLVPPFEGNKYTEWGLQLEPFLAAAYAAKHPEVKVQKDNKIRVHPRHLWATCNIDRLIVGGDEPVILEMKTTTSLAMKKWEGEIPLPYFCQGQWQMFVTGYSKIVFWIAVLDRREFVEFAFDADKAYQEKMLAEVLLFVDALERDDPSNIKMTVKDYDQLDPAPESKISATEEIVGFMRRYKEIGSQTYQLEKEKEKLSDLIKEFAGKNEAVVDEAGIVLATYLTVNKKPFSVSAKSYRQLSVKIKNE